VADPGLTGELAQGQCLDAVFPEGPLGLGEQDGAQAAMVVRAVIHARQHST